jgi:hypothetical protein
MEERRLTPLAGLLSVILFVIAVVVIESGDRPGDDATGAEMATYLADNLGTLAFAAVLWGVGTIALIWFLDGLRARIALASGQLARLTYGFGFAVALFMLVSFMPDVAGAIASDNMERNLEDGAAEAINSLDLAFFFAAELMLAGFFLAVGLASVRARALPVWLGWISLILAVVALIPPIGWAVVIFGLPLWLLLVSALFWRNSEPAAEVARPT